MSWFLTGVHICSDSLQPRPTESLWLPAVGGLLQREVCAVGELDDIWTGA